MAPSQDVTFNQSPDSNVNEAAEAFFKNFNLDDAETPSTPEPKKRPEPQRIFDDGKPAPERTEARPPVADETDDEVEQDEPEREYASDDSYFKLKVDGEELEVSAKDLKRLYGQEAALTQRSQQLAEQRKTAEAETVKATTALQIMLQRASERAAPFKTINFLEEAQKGVPMETLNSLRTAAVQAFEEEKFLQTELNGFMQAMQERQEAVLNAKAQEAWNQLNDPTSPYHVPDWTDDVYNDLRDFGVRNGIASDVMDNLVEAPVFKLLHDAMQYQKGSQRVVTTKKVDKTPRKIVKTTSSPAVRNSNDDKEQKAMQRLRQRGQPEDAADLFLARWERNSPNE